LDFGEGNGKSAPENFLPWNLQCDYGLRRRLGVTTGCAVRKRKTLRSEFEKVFANPLITTTFWCR